MTTMGVGVLERSGRWAQLVLVSGAALLAFLLAGKAAAGSALPLLLLVAAAGTGILLTRPRWVAFALLVLGCTVFRSRVGGLSVAGIRTDVVELLAYALVGYWVLARVRGRRLDIGLTGPLALWTAGVAVGALTALSAGIPRELVQGEAKAYLLLLVVPGVAAAFPGPAGRRALEALVLRVCTVGSVVVLVLVAAGRTVTAGSPTELSTLGLASRVERVRPALLGLLVLGILLQVARSATSGGWRPPAAIALYSSIVLFSYNRSTWLALIAVSLLCAHLVPGSRWRGRGWVRAALVVSAVIATGFLGASSGAFGERGRAVVDRVESAFDPEVLTESSYEERDRENTAAIRTLGAHPLTGVGLGREYGARFAFYNPTTRQTTFSERLYAHNTYLLVYLRLGVAGILALLWLAVRVMRSGTSAHREPDQQVAVRRVAAAFALLGFAASAVFQPFILSRSDVIAIAVALVLMTADAAPAPPRRARPS
jgi:O-antigen ligase